MQDNKIIQAVHPVRPEIENLHNLVCASSHEHFLNSLFYFGLLLYRLTKQDLASQENQQLREDIARFFTVTFNYLLENIDLLQEISCLSIINPISSEQILATIELSSNYLAKNNEIELFMPYIPSWEQIRTIGQGIMDSGAKHIAKLAAEKQDIFGLLYNKYDVANPFAGIAAQCLDTILIFNELNLRLESLLNLDFFKILFNNFVYNLEPKIKTLILPSISSSENPINHSIIEFLIEEFGAQIKPSSSKSEVIIVINLIDGMKHRLASGIQHQEFIFRFVSKTNYTSSVNGFEKKDEPQQDPIGIIAISSRGKLLHEPYGIFIRNWEEEILGGVVCKIEDYTHEIVELLWINESLRGKKLSEKLIIEAEEHAEERGCTTAGVTTSNFQAPWLYPKVGFKEVSSIPVSKSLTTFFFRKELSRPNPSGVSKGVSTLFFAQPAIPRKPVQAQIEIPPFVEVCKYLLMNVQKNEDIFSAMVDIIEKALDSATSIDNTPEPLRLLYQPYNHAKVTQGQIQAKAILRDECQRHGSVGAYLDYILNNAQQIPDDLVRYLEEIYLQAIPHIGGGNKRGCN